MRHLNILVLLLIGYFISNGAIAQSSSHPSANVTQLLESARRTYYLAVNSQPLVEAGIRQFETLIEMDRQHEARYRVYIGSLMALRGKHAFFPTAKYRKTLEGLAVMDESINGAGNDVEALFIYGTTMHYLPFFFGRGEDAHESFRRILILLPEQADGYDPELVQRVVAFMQENLKLNLAEMNKLNDVTTALEEAMPYEN